jgi:uncharacterized protein (TIGR02117 family)
LLASVLLLLLLIPPVYFGAALLGALIPANAGWKQPSQGITIFVETNGVHTWIVMPVVNAEMDWRPLVPATDIREPDLGGDHVAIGYGDRDFYLNTPEWKDLTVGRALGAAFGTGSSLVHVYHEPRPVADEEHRPIILTPGQYRRLAAYVVASFDRDPSGRTVPLIGRGYGPTDVFYEARGSYNFFYTCNEWAGAGLREAGVRVGVWTPFTQTIMRRL